MTKLQWILFGVIVIFLTLIAVTILAQSHLIRARAEQGIGSSTKAQVFVPE